MANVRVVVAYDVADDARRLRLAVALGRVGVRIQESVFEVESDDPTDLRQFLDGLVDVGRDRLSVYPLCARCEEKVHTVGVPLPDVLDSPYWIA